MLLDHLGGRAFAVPDVVEHFLGDLGRDDIGLDQFDQLGDMRRRQRVLAEVLAVGGQTRGDLVRHPVGDQLGVAALGGGLEVIGLGLLRDQHHGVVLRQAVIGHQTTALLVRQLGQVGLDLVDPGLFQLQRQQVGVGEVAIVHRLFLGPHRARFARRRIIQTGFLNDRAAVLEDLDLATRLVIDRLRNEAEAVDVLDLAARAQEAEVAGFLELGVVAGAADRDVDVGAQVALVHVAVAGAEIDQDGADLLDVGDRLFRRADVGARDNLHQRRARPVQIDVGFRRRQVVDQLARVLLQVQALDADVEEAAVLGLHLDHALAHDGVIQLADLIAGRQVGIEVVLAVELALQIDLRLQAQTRLHRLLDAVLVQGRQHAGEASVDQRHLLVRTRAKTDSGAREQLGLRRHLGVDFQPHDDFPVAGATFDQCFVVRHAHHHLAGLATKPAESSSAAATWKTVASSRALPMT